MTLQNKGNDNVPSYTAFKTRQGWLGLLASSRGITSLTLPYPTEKQALEAVAQGSSARRVDNSQFGGTIARIRDYFDGKPVDFTDALDFSAGTLFQQRVWKTCRLIGYGQTRPYSWIAKQIGQPAAARAVGNVLNKNPVPIIVPCHRVVAAGGGIGGYGGGLAVKKELLALEGVTFSD